VGVVAQCRGAGCCEGGAGTQRSRCTLAVTGAWQTGGWRLRAGVCPREGGGKVLVERGKVLVERGRAGDERWLAHTCSRRAVQCKVERYRGHKQETLTKYLPFPPPFPNPGPQRHHCRLKHAFAQVTCTV
jgi:hypothetical protein